MPFSALPWAEQGFCEQTGYASNTHRAPHLMPGQHNIQLLHQQRGWPSWAWETRGTGRDPEGMGRWEAAATAAEPGVFLWPLIKLMASH